MRFRHVLGIKKLNCDMATFVKLSSVQKDVAIQQIERKRCSVPTFHLSFWSVIFPDMLICQWRFLWEYKVMSVWSTLIGWRFWLTRLVDAYGAMQ